MHNGKHILGDEVLQPTQKALILDVPSQIMVLLQNRWGGKVGAKVKLVDERIKDASPLIIAWISELKNDMNMRLNVFIV